MKTRRQTSPNAVWFTTNLSQIGRGSNRSSAVKGEQLTVLFLARPFESKTHLMYIKKVISYITDNKSLIRDRGSVSAV